eukprot:m51a1_g1447 hypothetical protein (864) ;mRNA; r:142741-146302
MRNGDEAAEHQLLDHVLVIQLETKEGKPAPKVSYRFPPLVDGDGAQAESSATIAQFCFPEEAAPPRGHGKGRPETFSFVLTSTDGTKRFGYCRRFLDLDVPECYCIISLIPSFSLFCRMLDIVEARRRASSSAVFTFLKAVLAQPLPDPGASFTIKSFSATGDSMDQYTFTRPASEGASDYVSFQSLFVKLNVAQVVEVWKSLLFERRVLMVADDLETLSSTINAFCAMLSPFSWQHVLIPILPRSLAGYVTAPMPFFIGCLRAAFQEIQSTGMPLEEIVVLDLGSGRFLQRLEESSDRLPVEPAAALRNVLSVVVQQSAWRGCATAEQRDSMISRAFFRFFRTVLSGYERFFSDDQRLAKDKRHKKAKYFDNESFIKSKPEDVRRFLEMLQASQQWFMFTNDREDMASSGRLAESCPLLRPDSSQDPILETTPSTLAQDNPTCAACGATIRSTDLCSAYQGQYYHTKCYACSCCGELLEGDVVQVASGKPCCSSCGGKGGNLTPERPTGGRKKTKGAQMWATMRRFFSSSDDGGDDAAPTPVPSSSGGGSGSGGGLRAKAKKLLQRAIDSEGAASEDSVSPPTSLEEAPPPLPPKEAPPPPLPPKEAVVTRPRPSPTVSYPVRRTDSQGSGIGLGHARRPMPAHMTLTRKLQLPAAPPPPPPGPGGSPSPRAKGAPPGTAPATRPRSMSDPDLAELVKQTGGGAPSESQLKAWMRVRRVGERTEPPMLATRGSQFKQSVDDMPQFTGSRGATATASSPRGVDAGVHESAPAATPHRMTFARARSPRHQHTTSMVWPSRPLPDPRASMATLPLAQQRRAGTPMSFGGAQAQASPPRPDAVWVMPSAVPKQQRPLPARPPNTTR